MRNLIQPGTIPRSGYPAARHDNQRGFTLVELIIVVGIIGILASIAFPAFEEQLRSSKIARIVGDMHTIDKEIQAYFIDNHIYPPNLAAIKMDSLKDPWGRPYEYSPIPALKSSMTIILNDDFDLYSKGANGASANAFDATCEDDIVRAGDGGFLGLRP